MIRVARVIRHVGFEGLGTFEDPLRDAGYIVEHHEAGAGGLHAVDPLADDLLVVLGGPVGAYEAEAYPFVAQEITLLQRRLALSRPTLGLCLGAQLMAAALGARVGPGRAKEIGFAPLTLTPAGAAGPLRHLERVAVLHWHGDAFAIPDRAEGLAATPLCATQGFARGPNVLGLQFHPEFDADTGIEPWLIGHAAELAAARIDPRVLRADAARFGLGMRAPARAMMTEWLAGLR